MPKGTSIILTEEKIRDFDNIFQKYKKNKKKFKKKKKNFAKKMSIFLLPAESRLDYST